MGDIVLFEQDGALTDDRPVHRVVDETEHGYVTKGDGNPYRDQDQPGVPYVTDENLIGIVVFEFPLRNGLAVWIFSTLMFASGSVFWEKYRNRTLSKSK